MDDSCAVCADNLEWAAYGSCGHREVCSTCVVRLRFICGDRRCCICKTESSVVFITKALGDYTRFISDFSIFPSEPREGRLGPFWYHEDSQAFFDDVDHYRMIKAMCRLSCSVCDKMHDQSKDGPRYRGKLRSIEQLKGHLYHRHRLHMCTLCLEGRKVFICEQKLYTKSQLNQHINTGDSEVDGTESERGGFMGHPLCEFCRTAFYGDNELYSHMSTEHYTCHICQRQHPGQYEYYRNYDDLEMHFRRDHFLCEDESCLAKKFIVFQAESELKRHNTMEHGGRMSRSKRSAALQIPTSFRYRRSSEQDSWRRRGQEFHREPAGNELSAAIQASMETARTEGIQCNPPAASSVTASTADRIMDEVDPLFPSFESLSTSDSEQSARYLQALRHSSRSLPLGESSFPPLSGVSQAASRQNSETMATNTMAARLRRKSNQNTKLGAPAPAWPAVGRGLAQYSSSAIQVRPQTNNVPSRNLPYTASVGTSSSASVVAGERTRASSGIPVTARKIPHSASAPNLSDGRQLEPSISDFPPVCAAPPLSATPVDGEFLNVEDVQSANKSLVQKLRAALGYDEEKYRNFKEVSALFRQGVLDTQSYLDSVKDYGLSHLLLDLARLCPDPQKQKELVNTYNAISSDNARENGWPQIVPTKISDASTKRNKGKSVITEGISARQARVDGFLDTVRKLQQDSRAQEEDTEIFSKDSYRSKGKYKVVSDGQLLETPASDQPAPKSAAEKVSSSGSGMRGGVKQRKKTSKFHRVRLGDGSMSSLLDFKDPEPDLDPKAKTDPDNDPNPTGGIPIRGVWRKGNAPKLFS